MRVRCLNLTRSPTKTNMATGANTRSDATVRLTMKPASPGDCITNKMANELVRRLQGTLPPQGQVGDAVVSRTPPDDKSKIWYVADENGVPTGEVYAYNPRTGNWESTAQSIPPIPCLSANLGNLISTDSSGCWTVTTESVKEVAQTVTLTLSEDSGNILTLGSDGGVYLNQALICISEETINFISRDIDNCLVVKPSADAGNAVVAGEDDKMYVHLPKMLPSGATLKSGANPAGSIDLNTFTTVPDWATHAIIGQPNNQTFVSISGGFISHPAILANESIILYGFIKAQT